MAQDVREEAIGLSAAHPALLFARMIAGSGCIERQQLKRQPTNLVYHPVLVKSELARSAATFSNTSLVWSVGEGWIVVCLLVAARCLHDFGSVFWREGCATGCDASTARLEFPFHLHSP